VIKGDLRLDDSPIKTLSEGLKINGHAYLKNTRIKEIPKIHVQYTLNLQDSDVEKIPQGLIVGGDLKLKGAKNLHTLPKELVIGGGLNIMGTNIKETPEDLILGKGLNVSDIPELRDRKIKVFRPQKFGGKYLYVDSILTEIDRIKFFENYKLYISPYSTVIATTDDKIFAHGYSARNAIRALLYKFSTKDLSEYREYTLETVLSSTESILMFRDITNACS